MSGAVGIGAGRVGRRLLRNKGPKLGQSRQNEEKA